MALYRAANEGYEPLLETDLIAQFSPYRLSTQYHVLLELALPRGSYPSAVHWRMKTAIEIILWLVTPSLKKAYRKFLIIFIKNDDRAAIRFLLTKRADTNARGANEKVTIIETIITANTSLGRVWPEYDANVYIESNTWHSLLGIVMRRYYKKGKEEIVKLSREKLKIVEEGETAWVCWENRR